MGYGKVYNNLSNSKHKNTLKEPLNNNLRKFM